MGPSRYHGPMNTTATSDRIACQVLRSIRRELTYLYLRHDLDLDALPPALQTLFAGAEPAMRLELHSGSVLAQEDIATVLANLRDPGFHLQLPPREDPSGWLDLPRPKEP